MRYPFRTLIASASSRAVGALAAPALIAFGSFTFGCSDDPVAPDGTAGGGNDGGHIKLANENNFTTVTSELHLQSVTAAAEFDLKLDWSKIEYDLQCHPVKPAEDIDTVLFLRFTDTTKEAVSKLLDKGDLATEDLVAPAPFKFVPDGVKMTADLTDFAVTETKFDPKVHFKDNGDVYLAVFQNGTNLGQGARSMVFVEPDNGDNDTVVAPPNTPDADGKCPALDYKALLSTLTPLSVPKAGGSWVLDWKGMNTDSQGGKLDKTKIDRMLIGFYAGETPETLEKKFLDLEEIPTESWEIKWDELVQYVEINGAANRKAGGAPFSGFERSEQGTWIMGLFCDACQSPAPFVVTVLKPE
ncbi:MAG TPA: hypothetical protein VNN72_08370 [Polyangiaceae bacterium]|nr:hypothetical protein [Polyangiaceae bacterium]